MNYKLKTRSKNRQAFSLIELSIVVLIIGLLVASIIGGKSLVSAAALSKAKSLTTSSPIAGIEDLALWLETVSPKSFDTVLNDGDTVTTWNDINPQLTAKKNVTQSTAGQKPLYVKNGINNLPAVVFDATNDVLSATSISSYDLASPTQGITMCFVIKTNVGSAVILSSYDSLSGNTINAQNGGYMRWAYGTTDHVFSELSPDTNYFVGGGKTSIVCAIQDSIGMSTYVNGSLANPTPIANSPSITNYTSTLFIGASDSAGSFPFKGSIGELVIFKRSISDAERKDVELYLSKKWGIKLL